MMIKKILSIVLLLFMQQFAFAQSLQTIPYQAVVYTSLNKTAPVNSVVLFKVEIFNLKLSGTPAYVETIKTTVKDPQGIVSLNIGTGTVVKGAFKNINWSIGSKHLRVSKKLTYVPAGSGAKADADYTVFETKQLMSEPHELFAANTINAANSSSYKIVDNITQLVALAKNNVAGDVVYVKGYYTPGDSGGGIFMWRTDSFFINETITTNVNRGKGPQTIKSPFFDDNKGTIIQAKIDNKVVSTGRWVRQYDNYINVRYFGVMGKSSNNEETTLRIKNAIDFAFSNGYVTDAPTKGTTVFFPNGGYIVDKISIRNGVALLGDSFDRTIIVATLPKDTEYRSSTDEKSDFIFQLDSGVVQTTIENFSVLGRHTLKGCFYLVAKNHSNGGGGGLWNSVFKNIKITDFDGDGIFLKGEGNPTQFNVFEKISVNRFTAASRCLRIHGSVNQHSFINCLFDGTKPSEDGPRTLQEDIEIVNSGTLVPGVITFLNCSIQDSEVGVRLQNANSVTFDTCWFESLGTAIKIEPSTEGVPSKSINIVNNFFANAAGFGSIKADNNRIGSVIDVTNSQVNVINNFVRTSIPESDIINDDLFISSNSPIGINVSGNSFQVPILGRTQGIIASITSTGGVIDCKNNKEILVSSISASEPSTIIIEEIKSDIVAGESLMIWADSGTITFKSKNFGNLATKNIFLAGKDTLTLYSGEVAVFTKFDNERQSAPPTYMLSSVVKATAP